MKSKYEQVVPRASSDTFFPFVILNYFVEKEKNGERDIWNGICCVLCMACRN